MDKNLVLPRDREAIAHVADLLTQCNPRITRCQSWQIIKFFNVNLQPNQTIIREYLCLIDGRSHDKFCGQIL